MQNVNVHFYYQLAMITHGVRRAGSAALDLAYVASGRLDGFWEFGLNPWDMAAGILLITEAGGKCSDMHGAPARLRGPHLLADNGAVMRGCLRFSVKYFAANIATLCQLSNKFGQPPDSFADQSLASGREAHDKFAARRRSVR